MRYLIYFFFTIFTLINSESKSKSLNLEKKCINEVADLITLWFYASDGWVDIYEGGQVYSKNKFYKYQNGVKKTNESLPHNANAPQGLGNKVRMGLNIKIVDELTVGTKSHIKYGEVKIKINNSSTLEEISSHVRKPTDPPISVPSSGVNVSVDVSGIHFESALQSNLIEEVAGSRKLATTLPNGEKIYKSKIKVFIQEINNGQGGWKTVAKEKTWWPSSWSEQKIWENISEAFTNKTSKGTNKWEGLTSDGIKIEIYTDDLGNISTAYIIP